MQCGRFHDLTAFDGARKSCRDQLSKHNARRRRRAQAEARGKGSMDGTAAAGAGAGSGMLTAMGLGGMGGGGMGAAGGGVVGEGDVGRLLTTLMTNPTQLHAFRLLLGMPTHPALPATAALPGSDGCGADGSVGGSGMGSAGPAEPGSYGLARDVVAGHGEYAPTFSSDQRVLRISMKLFNKTPADLPLELRTQISTWMGAAPAGMEAAIRPGCVFLTVQALLDVATHAAASSAGAAARLVGHLLGQAGSPFWHSGVYTVQIGKEIVRVAHGGIRDVGSPSTCHGFPTLTRVGPLAVVSGEVLKLTLAGYGLDAPNAHVVVRWHGCHAKVPLPPPCTRSSTGSAGAATGGKGGGSGGRSVVVVDVPGLPRGYTGCVWVEVERGAWLSPALPLLAVDCEALRDEINRWVKV